MIGRSSLSPIAAMRVDAAPHCTNLELRSHLTERAARRGRQHTRRFARHAGRDAFSRFSSRVLGEAGRAMFCQKLGNLGLSWRYSIRTKNRAAFRCCLAPQPPRAAAPADDKVCTGTARSYCRIWAILGIREPIYRKRKKDARFVWEELSVEKARERWGRVDKLKGEL
jgi:hypothetical protein